MSGLILLCPESRRPHICDKFPPLDCVFSHDAQTQPRGSRRCCLSRPSGIINCLSHPLYLSALFIVTDRKYIFVPNPHCATLSDDHDVPFSMASLPPNASVTDIEEELLFTRLLLDSIDPDSDDAEAQRQEHYQTLEQLENLLNSRHQQPTFDGTSEDPESYYRQIQGAGPSSAAGPGQFSTRSFTPASMPRKRPRTQSGSSLQPQSNKSRRTTPAPSPSTTSPGTPSSFESLEVAEPGFEQRRGDTHGTRTAAMERALELQKEAEAMAAERAKRAREDAAMAQSYMTPPLRAPSSSQNRTQAVLNRDGSFRRETRHEDPPSHRPRIRGDGIQSFGTAYGSYATPDPSANATSTLPILPASPSGTGRAAHGWGSHLAVPKVEGGITPLPSSRGAYGPGLGGSDVIDLTGDDEEDEDVKIIPGGQFAAPQVSLIYFERCHDCAASLSTFCDLEVSSSVWRRRALHAMNIFRQNLQLPDPSRCISPVNRVADCPAYRRPPLALEAHMD